MSTAVEPGAPLDRRRELVADIAFVVVIACAAGLTIAHAPSAVRFPFILAAMLTCPGYAWIRAAGLALRDDAAALTVALSLAVTALLSTLEAVTRWWQPKPTALAVAAVAVVTLAATRRFRPARSTLLRPLDPAVDEPAVDEPAGDAVDNEHDANTDTPPTSRRTVARLDVPLAALVVVAVVVWALSVRHVNLVRLSAWGLLPRLPIAWYVGVGVTVFGCLMSQRVSGRARRALSAAFLAVLVLYLYCTAPAIEGDIRYDWTYKHLAVVRSIIAVHGVHQTDIYQRWPGVFAATAVLATLAGHLDPTPYLRWGEPFFTAVDLVMLYPLARRFTTERGAWCACYFFVGSNWVGQQYFSPQAFAFVLTLACLLLATSLLVGTIAWRPLLAIVNRLGIPAAVPAQVRAAMVRPATTKAIWWIVVPALVVVDAAIIVSHQLTPYVVLLELGGLVIAGLLRPRWAIGLLLVLTIGFLLPNLTFIQDNFGLLSSLDPFRNAASAPSGTTSRSAITADQSHLALLLSVFIWVIALVGMALRYRRREHRRAVLVIAILFLAPFLTLFVQSYGGEARFRILLFSLPASSIGAAWLWERSREYGVLRRGLASLALLPLPVALFVPNFFGKEDLYYVPPGEIAASAWIATDSNGQVVAVLDPAFPGLQNSSNITANGKTSILDLLASAPFNRDLRQSHPVAQALKDVLSSPSFTSPHGYVVFSTTEAAYARDYEAFGGLAAYQQIQHGVATSPLFTRVYANSDTAIYQIR